MKRKVSFDFDDTLEHESTQEYAKTLLDKGIEVHIVTTRYEDPSKYSFPVTHDDLYAVAKKLGIPNEHIHFTNFDYKIIFFRNNSDFVFHVDDNREEIRLLKAIGSKVKGVWSLFGGYQAECNELLNILDEND